MAGVTAVAFDIQTAGMCVFWKADASKESSRFQRQHRKKKLLQLGFGGESSEKRNCPQTIYQLV